MQIISKFLLCLIPFSFSYSQSSSFECGWYGKKRVEERRRSFPFNEAKKVYLISFPSSHSLILDEKTEQEIKYDSINYSKFNYKILEVAKLPKAQTPNYLVIEKVQLNQNQIDSLSNFFFNYKVNKNRTPQNLPIEPIGCYIPRNAVLFVNERDQIFSYLEVCFECQYIIQLPDQTIKDFNKLSSLDKCRQRINILKDFFVDAGIKYGTKNK